MISHSVSGSCASVSATPHRRLALSEGAAFVLLASLATTFLAASSAPTPLYGIYQARFGFSPITTTVVFGVYAIAVLGSLLTVGRLSDHVGRRPVLLVAVALQALALLLFATVDGTSDLLIARVVQGVSTGSALGAIGAGLVDLNRARGTLANAVAPMTGTATGALLSGVFVQYLPAPQELVYLVLFAVFVVQFCSLLVMPEPATPRPGALASLRPDFQLPAELRISMLIAAPLLIASWSLVGFYASLGPALLKSLFGHGSVLLAGLTLFTLASGGATAVLLLQKAAARTLVLIGASALPVGVAGTLLAVSLGSAPAFFVGTTVAGAGFGTAFQGAIRTLVPNAPAHARAGVLSIIFVICYLAMGLPAIAGGFRVVATHDLGRTAREYGLGVMLLALTALAGSARRRAIVA